MKKLVGVVSAAALAIGFAAPAVADCGPHALQQTVTAPATSPVQTATKVPTIMPAPKTGG